MEDFRHDDEGERRFGVYCHLPWESLFICRSCCDVKRPDFLEVGEEVGEREIVRREKREEMKGEDGRREPTVYSTIRYQREVRKTLDNVVLLCTGTSHLTPAQPVWLTAIKSLLPSSQGQPLNDAFVEGDPNRKGRFLAQVPATVRYKEGTNSGSCLEFPTGGEDEGREENEVEEGIENRRA